MTKDLRQAILALTNEAKRVAGRQKGLVAAANQVGLDAHDPLDVFNEALIEQVLALMPPGPILETLWAGLPVPTAVMSGPEGAGFCVWGYYPDKLMADAVHMILAKPFDDHCELLRVGRLEADATSTKARIEREHALEKRLLAERDAFDETAPDNPLRLLMAEELNGALYCEYPTGLDISNHVEEAMARLRAASTAPIHIDPEGEEEADGAVRPEA